MDFDVTSRKVTPIDIAGKRGLRFVSFEHDGASWLYHYESNGKRTVQFWDNLSTSCQPSVPITASELAQRISEFSETHLSEYDFSSTHTKHESAGWRYWGGGIPSHMHDFWVNYLRDNYPHLDETKR